MRPWFSITSSENRTVYEIIWKKVVEPDRPQENIIRRMRVACWIIKATDTHSEYVIITAFPRKQWLLERVYITLYVHCLSCYTRKTDGQTDRQRQGELNRSICTTSFDQKTVLEWNSQWKVQSAVCRMKTIEVFNLGTGPGNKLYPYIQKQC